MADLTEHEIAVLHFARTRWNAGGRREQAITDLFGMTSFRYDQELNSLLDRPEALMHDPVLVKRLRRLRATRAEARRARGLTA